MAREIEFNQPTKYRLIKALGSGACGETVLLEDEAMATFFVAKKYSPIQEIKENQTLFAELMSRFQDEARILFRLNHPNVVRVFNFYDYSEIKTSYILMEFVEGLPILDFLENNAHIAERAFEGVIDGFVHLQDRKVLHRDIRPANILVDESGVAKIIDFGFGKSIQGEVLGRQHKSISLNWWCETPPEFEDGTYDFQTEVYFVGKLFQRALADGMLIDFKYKRLVGQMCDPDRSSRPKHFQAVQSTIKKGKFDELKFSQPEIRAYRKFANELSWAVASVRTAAKFERDANKILSSLEELHRQTMLEEKLIAQNKLVQVFIDGGFTYYTSSEIYVETILNFVELLRGLSADKRAVVVENLVSRLEACDRTPERSLDDEIPF